MQNIRLPNLNDIHRLYIRFSIFFYSSKHIHFLDKIVTSSFLIYFSSLPLWQISQKIVSNPDSLEINHLISQNLKNSSNMPFFPFIQYNSNLTSIFRIQRNRSQNFTIMFYSCQNTIFQFSIKSTIKLYEIFFSNLLTRMLKFMHHLRIHRQ